MTSFQDTSLTGFAELLASGAPTPGGGCAAALSGALAASLVAMVARTTAANAAFADRAAQMSEIAAEADGLREELLGLVDEDAKAFDQVTAAFRLPKRTPEEQAARTEAIQRGYRSATEPPALVCTRSLRALELAAQVAETGNPNAASDAGVAALLAAAALEGGALNVLTNIGSIRDEELRATHAAGAEAARTRGRTLRDRALAAAQAKLA